MNTKSSVEILSEMFSVGTKEQVETIGKLSINETNVLEELAKAGLPFTWETIKEHSIDEYSRAIEVRLYVPGFILYGRKVYSIGTDECKTAHTYALYDAIKPLLNNNFAVKQNNISQPMQEQQPVQPMQQTSTTQPLSSDEIMNIVQQQSNANQQQQSTKITTAEQMKEDPREEIPFEDIDMSSEELDKMLTGNATSAPQQQAPQSQGNGSMGFSTEQIQRMIEFKKRYNITTDEVLGSYINAWNNKLSRKEELNGSNVDSFLEWTNLLGKAPL